MSRLKLGWIGLGNMGTPMVKNLLKAGFEVVVFNRTKQKEAELIANGASTAPDPQTLLEDCDIVFTMLSNDEAVKMVFEGEKGLLTNPAAGKMIIDMSTVSPDTSRYLSELCKKNDIDFLEAPVSGSVKPAQDGTLIILVGGETPAYEKAKPAFDALGKLSVHVGGAGVGGSAKLAINYLLGLNLQGLAETLLFAEKNGVNKTDMLTIINEGACGNGITKLKTPSILNESYPAAFALKHLVKDLGLAKAAGLDAPLIDPLFHTFQQAQQEGLGEEDVMAVIKSLSKK
ncbi:NAD(P)-dependent oxidoreductase [Pedobacter sp. N36a]|uniref:NAD(P)-dependent oxidoreductase n=1 Tax=Pedobacter sp. N36a TaxID=2767996 RepID=UPI00165731A2|nr:NAD(P)-dependent oxidoreductase [Pedobacter sp. N36a]MBC8985344.1 NAD(P)-dependent oxidoreductase [Pedobacter sp. N36a]